MVNIFIWLDRHYRTKDFHITQNAFTLLACFHFLFSLPSKKHKNVKLEEIRFLVFVPPQLIPLEMAPPTDNSRENKFFSGWTPTLPKLRLVESTLGQFVPWVSYRSTLPYPTPT